MTEKELAEEVELALEINRKQNKEAEKKEPFSVINVKIEVKK